MQTKHRSMRSGLLAIVPLLVLSTEACHRSSDPAAARLSPLLGSAESFAVLGSQTVTNTGPTMVFGNLGVSPNAAVTGFPPGTVSGGAIHAADGVALQARNDVNTAYIDAAGQPCAVDLTGQDLGGQTLVPGVYCFKTSAQLTGPLVLDTKGDPNAVFTFQIGSTLTTASDATVSVLGGSGCNVYWQVGSSATLGTRTKFVGNILALTSITLTTGANVGGRALAQNGAVTMDTNQVGPVTCASAGGTGGSVGMGGGAGGPGGMGESDAGSPDGPACLSPRAQCGGDSCVDLNENDSNCGSCGHSCASGECCQGGVCKPHCDGTMCGGICVDVKTDDDNCGSCGNKCGPGVACVAGACVCTGSMCGAVCVRLGSNPSNCGACGNVCPVGQWCSTGVCMPECMGTICGGKCVDLSTNDHNCGSCGARCAEGGSCSGGVCICLGTVCGTTCVDLATNASNCGSCGSPCGPDECCKAGACEKT